MTTQFDFREHSIEERLKKEDKKKKITRKHDDPTEDMYEEVEDSGRGERGVQRSQRLVYRSIWSPRYRYSVKLKKRFLL